MLLLLQWCRQFRMFYVLAVLQRYNQHLTFEITQYYFIHSSLHVAFYRVTTTCKLFEWYAAVRSIFNTFVYMISHKPCFYPKYIKLQASWNRFSGKINSFPKPTAVCVSTSFNFFIYTCVIWMWHVIISCEKHPVWDNIVYLNHTQKSRVF